MRSRRRKLAEPCADIFKGKKALVMGLGLHGGGTATVRWLIRHGAKVTVTDLRDKTTLLPSLRELRGLGASFVLGKHRMEDIKSHDLIVVGPGVPRESAYLLFAKKIKKVFENDASLFFRFLKNTVIGVTGTRGKTTTTLWVAELLKKKYSAVRQSGVPENAELKEFERINGKNTPAVVELSSWQLEYLPQSRKSPHIAAITNIYPEHLNRYRDIYDYADAKANIFLHQHKEDMLVLNYDDPWHRYYLKKKPKSAVYYISTKVLPTKLSGAYVKNGKLVLRRGGTERALFSVVRFVKERGEHNLENLIRSVLMTKLFEPTLKVTERDALLLPAPRMRQETIYKKERLMVVNDSAATSPDATIAAIKHFAPLGNQTSKSLGRLVSKCHIILITGGTDKELDFNVLAVVIKKYILKKHVVLLEGSATTKLILALRKINYFGQCEPFEYLELASCVKEAFQIAHETKGKKTILFSPGAASFEKFLHEFDRGEQFNAIVRKNVK